MTEEEARKLLDRCIKTAIWCEKAPGFWEEYQAATKSCLDAMTLPDETIAEQQREIERLKHRLGMIVGAYYEGCTTTIARRMVEAEEVLK